MFVARLSIQNVSWFWNSATEIIGNLNKRGRLYVPDAVKVGILKALKTRLHYELVQYNIRCSSRYNALVQNI